MVCSRSRVGHWIIFCLMGSGMSIGTLWVVQVESLSAGVGGRAKGVLVVGCRSRLASATTEVAWRCRLLASVLSCKCAAGVGGVLVPSFFWVKLLFVEVKLALKVRHGCASRVSESLWTSSGVSLLSCTWWTGVGTVGSSASPPCLLVFRCSWEVRYVLYW